MAAAKKCELQLANETKNKQEDKKTMDVSMLILCMVPACVFGSMLGIGDVVMELLYRYCKPLRDRIDKQVEKYMEDEEE